MALCVRDIMSTHLITLDVDTEADFVAIAAFLLKLAAVEHAINHEQGEP